MDSVSEPIPNRHKDKSQNKTIRKNAAIFNRALLYFRLLKKSGYLMSDSRKEDNKPGTLGVIALDPIFYPYLAMKIGDKCIHDV